jgi:hypothetical protein
LWDREERHAKYPLDVYIPEVGPMLYSVCWAANVITFGFSNVLGSSNTIGGASIFQNGSVQSIFQNGWMAMGFAGGRGQLINNGSTSISGRGQATTGSTTTYVGLPVIGFAVVSYTNGTLVVGSQTVLSNYGGNFVHKTSTTIQ